VSNLLPLPIGKTSSSASLAADVGKVYLAAGKLYRLVKFASAITDPESKVVVTAYSAGVPTWTVDTTTSAASEAVAGVIPASLTTDIAANAYGLILIKGAGSVLSQTTAIVDGDLLQSATVAGRVDEIVTTVSHLTLLKSCFGKATNTAGATAAGLAITCLVDVGTGLG